MLGWACQGRFFGVGWQRCIFNFLDGRYGVGELSRRRAGGKLGAGLVLVLVLVLGSGVRVGVAADVRQR